MATFVTNKGLALLNKAYWEGAADIEVALLTSSASPDKDWDFMNDVTNEVAVAGYARTNIASRVSTIDNTNDRVTYDAADTDIGTLAAGATIRYAVIFENVVGADSGKPILLIMQLGSDFVTSGVPYRQVWAEPITYSSM